MAREYGEETKADKSRLLEGCVTGLCTAETPGDSQWTLRGQSPSDLVSSPGGAWWSHVSNSKVLSKLQPLVMPTFSSVPYNSGSLGPLDLIRGMTQGTFHQ